MKKYVVVSLLVLTTLVGLLTLTVLGQGGFESWRSVNMTGMGDSYYVMNRQGVGDSRFIIATSVTWAYAPTNLALTLIGDNEILITWTMGTGACNSMVRAAIGRVPTSRSDGYLVYYGSGTSATDWIDEDETVYYRVWSQGCSDIWENTGIWDSIGGFAVGLIVLGILALGLTIAMFATRSSMLGFPAGIFWAVLSGFAYQQSSTTWDWQYILFFGAIGMAIFCFLAAYTLRKRDLAGPDLDEGEFIDENAASEEDDPW